MCHAKRGAQSVIRERTQHCSLSSFASFGCDVVIAAIFSLFALSTFGSTSVGTGKALKGKAGVPGHALLEPAGVAGVGKLPSVAGLQPERSASEIVFLVDNSVTHAALS